MGAKRDIVGSTPVARETLAQRVAASRRSLWDEAEADQAMTARGVGSTVILLCLLVGALTLYWLELPLLANPVPSLLSVFVVMLASVVVTRPEPFRLTTASAALVTIAAVTSAGLCTIVPPAQDVLAYELRHVAVSTVLLTMVILRGRIVWGWFGRVGVMAVMILSAVVYQKHLATRLTAFLGNTAILLAATVLVIWLTRSRRLSATAPELQAPALGSSQA